MIIRQTAVDRFARFGKASVEAISAKESRTESMSVSSLLFVIFRPPVHD